MNRFSAFSLCLLLVLGAGRCAGPEGVKALTTAQQSQVDALFKTLDASKVARYRTKMTAEHGNLTAADQEALAELKAQYAATVEGLTSLRKASSASYAINQKRFYYWSIGGVAIGFGGAISSATTSPERRKTRYAQIGSALAGVVSGIVGLYHFETKAQEFLKCSNALAAGLMDFSTTWNHDSAFLKPDGSGIDQGRVASFNKARAALIQLSECKTAWASMTSGK
jgi:hypothetical protein